MVSPQTSGRNAVTRLSVARLASAAGSQAARTALVYEIYERTGSARWVTAVLLTDVGVAALAGPVAGWIGDNFERRIVMICAELAAAAAYLALVFVHAPVLLVIGSLVATLVNSPFLPASSAAIPNLVDGDDLRWANSRLSLSTNGALIIGPIVGGWVLALVGLGAVFAINAISFAASAILIARVSGSFHHANEHTSGGLRDGYRVVVSNRVIRSVTLALGLTFFTFGLALVADPVLAADFDAGSIGYALLYSTWGVVAVGGSWLAGHRFAPHWVPWGIIGGLATVAAACLAIAVLPWFWAIVTLGALGGAGSGVLFPLTTGLVQQHSPDGVRARVFGVIEAFDKSIYAIGMLVAAPLVDKVGAQAAYGVIGTIIAVAALGLLGLPAAVRSMTE